MKFDLLAWFGMILAVFYLALWFVAPQKWLYSLLLLLYAAVMVFVADDIKMQFGSSDLLYSVLDTSAYLAFVFLLLLLLVEGLLKLGGRLFIQGVEARSNAADACYWIVAGLAIPFVLLDSRLFARYPGTTLLPALLATAICAFAVFLIIYQRGFGRKLTLLLPGYAVGMLIVLAASLALGVQASSLAAIKAAGQIYCIRSGSTTATTVWDMTPLTMISREFSEFHAELTVEAESKSLLYVWSWRLLSFAPVPPEKHFPEECSK